MTSLPLPIRTGCPSSSSPSSSSNSNVNDAPYPRGIKRVRIDENHPPRRAYFILPGIYTGDIWHCAAAQILWEYRRENSADFPFPDFQPVTASVISEPRSGDKESPSQIEGKASYDYLKNIGLPFVVVATEAPTTQYTWDQIHDAMTYKQVDDSFNAQQKSRKYEYDEQLPVTVTSRGGLDDPYLLKLYTSTSVMMQLVRYLGVFESVQILKHRLWNDRADDAEDIKKSANDIFEALKELITTAMKEANANQVLLFNYRLSRKNTAYNSNDDLRSDVRKAAQKQKTAIVLVGTGFGPMQFKKQFNNEHALDIYNVNSDSKKFMQDKRITACFWTLVADHLQIGPRDGTSLASTDTRNVIGLIGGRSGSVDIASFVGVKLVSWDEPLFDRGRYSSGKLSQIPQLGRLLDQKPVSFIVYLDPTTMAKVSSEKIEKKRKLAESRATDEKDRKGKRKEEDPELNDDKTILLPNAKNEVPGTYTSLRGDFMAMLLDTKKWPENQENPLRNMDIDDAARLTKGIKILSVESLKIRPNYLVEYQANWSANNASTSTTTTTTTNTTTTTAANAGEAAQQVVQPQPVYPEYGRYVYNYENATVGKIDSGRFAIEYGTCPTHRKWFYDDDSDEDE